MLGAVAMAGDTAGIAATLELAMGRIEDGVHGLVCTGPVAIQALWPRLLLCLGLLLRTYVKARCKQQHNAYRQSLEQAVTNACHVVSYSTLKSVSSPEKLRVIGSDTQCLPPRLFTPCKAIPNVYLPLRLRFL